MIDEFRQSIPVTVNIKLVNEYVGLCAKDNQWSPEELMANVAAAGEIPQFWASFESWVVERKKTTEEKPKPIQEQKKPANPDKEKWKHRAPDGSALVYCTPRKRPLAPAICDGCQDPCEEFTRYKRV